MNALAPLTPLTPEEHKFWKELLDKKNAELAAKKAADGVTYNEKHPIDTIDPYDKNHRYTVAFGKDASDTSIFDPQGNKVTMCTELSIEMSAGQLIPILTLKLLNPVLTVKQDK
jgi:hypothetical protein